MADNKEKLFTQFPPVSYETWRAKVDADLKGVPFDKKLVWRTNEGFNVQPMYQRGDIADLKTTDTLPGEFPYVRGTRADNNWLTRQEILPSDAAEANKVALDVLGKGVNSLGFNLAETTSEAIAAALEGIDLEKVEVNFKSCPRKALALAEVLVAYLKKVGAEKTFRGSIDYNPFKRAFRHGTDVDAAVVVADAKALLSAVKDVPGLRCLGVDSVMFNNSGAYIFQELGYALAWGAEWLTLLTEAGVPADEVAARVKFNMGISSNYFMELAKFRAARMMWAQIVEQYKPESKDACKMMAHAITSRFNQTIYDAHVNLLRSQTEAMSAALAGVDSITVTPFDVPYKTPDEFSERIARNQQLLLKEESHLDKVVDPAGGSYYVETLTVSLAQEAWKLFIEVEDKGGFVACVNSGDIQKAVNESSVKRHQDMARRKEILLGTNQFPNFNEMAAGKIENMASACGKEASSCGCAKEGDSAKVLRTERQASDFEALRLATEHAENRPKAFMLTIGNLAMRLARAQFSSNFFGCAGYEILDNIGFNTVEEGVAAAMEKGADIVILCSSDDEYAQYAPEAFKLLDGRAEFVVAGAPACTEDLKALGIENFIHVRSNVLETLQQFNQRLLKK
ncbi:MAG: methylmalonyl-CoA mutase small subunit [Muribaculaceae bacterium]|nr:methylmalonyl-CoA mutase small subunit [Muribaculaceae bacterium]